MFVSSCAELRLNWVRVGGRITVSVGVVKRAAANTPFLVLFIEPIELELRRILTASGSPRPLLCDNTQDACIAGLMAKDSLVV